MSGAQASLAAAAVSNPMFQNAMKKSVFEAISGEETDNPDAIAAKDAETMNALEGVDAKELSQIKQWYYRLRVAMIEAIVQTYVYYRHPKFEKYMMKLHYYDKVKPGNRSLV
eukprot:gene19034-24854_t